jgi:hypothetical protein
MDGYDILARCRQLNDQYGVPPSEFVIIGGAVLALHDIRPTHDFDAVVPVCTYERLQHQGWSEGIGAHGNQVLQHDGFDIGISWRPDDQPNFEELKSRAEYFIDEGGIFLASLKDVLDWKSHYGREKDMRDLALPWAESDEVRRYRNRVIQCEIDKRNYSLLRKCFDIDHLENCPPDMRPIILALKAACKDLRYL